MRIKFWKMSGAGNDFVCIDNRFGKIKLTRRQREHLCHRQFGIGADGLLLIETPKKGQSVDYIMRYYNADGGEAEMCGNGARCFARFVQKTTRTRKKKITFLTPAGVVGAQFFGEQVRVDLTPVEGGKLRIPVQGSFGKLTVHYADTGVPHVVVPVRNAEKTDVFALGRELRNHKAFAPRGANVNFFEVLKPNSIRVRTYERGVEDETLACGTGVAASAWVTYHLKGFTSPVSVRVQGGPTLKVYFNVTDEGEVTDLQLHGPATFVYQGEIDV
ncbi:MAG: diaminopimelate epimerase [Verrucomicrobiota bacterium]